MLSFVFAAWRAAQRPEIKAQVQRNLLFKKGERKPGVWECEIKWVMESCLTEVDDPTAGLERKQTLPHNLGNAWSTREHHFFEL